MADLPRDDRADERLSILPLWAHRVLLLLIGVVLVGMDLSRLTGLWPCDIACQGGAHYQTLFGVSVTWPALFAHALLACLAWIDVRRGRSNLWTVRLVHVLVGVAVFFLIIARELDLSCIYCLAVHWLTFLAFFLTVPFMTRRVSLWLPIAGWLITNALFHHGPVADVAAPSAATAAMSSLEADRGRTYGVKTAPWQLDLTIELTCRSCAEQYRPLMDALRPQIAAGRVKIVVHHQVRPSQAASRPAAMLALAAAAMGEHASAMEVLLGTNPDAGFDGLKARLGEVIDPVRLNAVLSAQMAAIEALLADDQKRFGKLRAPSAVLLNTADGTSKAWAGDLPLPAILAALDGAL